MQHLGKNLVIALSLLAAGFFVAWLRFRPYLEVEGRFTDGLREYETLHETPVRYAVWDDPEALPPAINTAARESRPALSPDGRFLVFAVGERGLNAELWIAELEEGRPRGPRPLVELNGERDELAPAFAADALLFASDREGSAGGLDVWRASYRDGSFGHAEPLGPGVNTRVDETDPAPVPGGRALAFASNRDAPRGAGYDLFLASPDAVGAYEVEAISELNTVFDEREPAFTADGRTLVFSSDRGAARQDFDLYRSLFDRGAWLAPEPLEGLNTAGDERGPWPSLDGFSLLFAVEDEAGASDLYRAHSLELFRQPSRPVGWLDAAILAALLLLALLALLAKRWDRLEVIYRCFLVSLVAHLLLLWWFQHIHPESQPVPVRPGEKTFQVRLASASSGPPASARERGGRLEVERASSSEPEARPAREAPSAESDADAPAEAMLRELARAAQPAESAPARAEFAPQPESAADAARDAQLRDAPQRAPLREGAAPALALVAREAVHTSGEARAEGTPTRARRVTAEPTSAEAPAAARAERAARAEGESLPAPSTAAGARPAPEELAVARAAQLAVSQPSERFERARGEASGLALEVGSTSAAPTARDAHPSPTRAADALTTAESGERAAPRRDDLLAPRRLDQPAAPPAGELALEPPSSDGSRAVALEGPRAEARSPAPSSRGDGAPRADAVLLALAATGTARATDPDAAAVPGRWRSDAPREATPAPTPTARAEVGLPAPRAAASATPPGPSAKAPEPAVVRPPAGLALHQPEEAAPPRSAASGDGAPRADEALLALAGSHPPRERAGALESAPGRWRADAERDEDRARPAARAVEAAQRIARGTGPAAPDPFEHTPYRTRFGLAKEQALEEHGGSEETEAAVASGLAYLASIQRDEGFWGDVDERDGKYHFVLVGKTGLCLLAFLGTGHTQDSDTEHSRVVRRALDFLLAVQDEESGHYGYTSSYGHAIATYALAECFALTEDERLRPSLERAVAHIVANQERRRDPQWFGGWGYYYPDRQGYRGDEWPRVSVTAWQVMALESARLGGIEVRDRVFRDAKVFLQNAWDGRRGAFRYTHQPQRLDSVYPILPGSTPAALFALSLLGEDLEGAQYAGALGYVSERTPRRYDYTGERDFVSRAQGNLYFWYYASLAMFRRGGNPWRRWNEAMKDTLLPAQREDGSWRPISVYALQYAGDDERDRSYTTAMCVLTLEVYYRYFTPLLQVDAVPNAGREGNRADPATGRPAYR